MVPSNGQNEPTSSDEKGTTADRRPRLEDFLRSEKLGQWLGFGALPVLCCVVPLLLFPLFTVCYYLPLSLCCFWSWWLSSYLLRLHHDGIHWGRPCRWARAIEAQRKLSVLLLFCVSCANPSCVSILTMASGLGILVSIFDFSFLHDFFGTSMV
jgi:hypothetical protein